MLPKNKKNQTFLIGWESTAWQNIQIIHAVVLFYAPFTVVVFYSGVEGGTFKK